jgi:hypothetical protein
MLLTLLIYSIVIMLFVAYERRSHLGIGLFVYLVVGISILVIEAVQARGDVLTFGAVVGICSQMGFLSYFSMRKKGELPQ